MLLLEDPVDSVVHGETKVSSRDRSSPMERDEKHEGAGADGADGGTSDGLGTAFRGEVYVAATPIENLTR